MKEFRFKILQEGDSLFSFDDKEMVIKTKDHQYRIYNIAGFDDNKPTFSKNAETVTICPSDSFNDKVLIVKRSDKYAVYKIDKFKKKLPCLNLEFVVLITKGIGKIEVFDPETRVTFKLPAGEY